MSTEQQPGPGSPVPGYPAPSAPPAQASAQYPPPAPGYAPPQPQGYPPPQPQGYPPQPLYAQVVVQSKTNGLAVAALVLGIVWVYWVGSVLAVIFGHVALNQINKSNGTQQGRGLAIAGLVLGWIGVAILAILLIAGAAASSH